MASHFDLDANDMFFEEGIVFNMLKDVRAGLVGNFLFGINFDWKMSKLFEECVVIILYA